MINNFCICLSGLDGTGKSLIAKELIKFYKKKNTKHVWSRYKNYTSKPFLLFTKIIGLNYKQTIDGVTIGYHDFYKNKFISFIFLFFQWIDQIIEIFIKFRISKKIIISDRSILDTLVDLSVDTKLNKIIFGIYGHSLIKLMPKNTFFFILERNLRKIEKKRKDVFYDKNLYLRIKLFNEISKKFKILIIKNNHQPELTVRKIITKININEKNS